MALAGSLTSVNRSFQFCRLTLLRMLAAGHESCRLSLALFNAGSLLRFALTSNYLSGQGLNLIVARLSSLLQLHSNQRLVQFKESKDFLLRRGEILFLSHNRLKD